MSGTLAIDLGSTTTVVAWQEEQGTPSLLALPPYSLSEPCVVPSLLWLSHQGHSHPLIGRQVLEAGLAGRSDPGLCRDFKRWIGAAVADSEAPAPWGSWMTPEEAGSSLLRAIWKALPHGLEPRRLVLTAPVDSYSGYRRWLMEVLQDLPVPEIALVDEPTAAAIGCGLAPGSRVLVVDFGGGTLDVSLVVLQGGEGRSAPVAQLLRFAGRDLQDSRQRLRTARVLGKAGVPIGGRDLDHWIAAALRPGESLTGELLAGAEALKCALSKEEQALSIVSPLEGPPYELRLNRSGFEELLESRGLGTMIRGLLDAMAAAARREGFELSRLDAVLPVGGSSRIPWLRRLLKDQLPSVPLRDERPVESVALGALALTPGVQIRDVLSRGVCLRCWDQRSRAHLWHPLFQAGQHWPTPQAQALELVLASSGADQSALELVFGEPLPEERAEVVFVDGVPLIRPRQAGMPQVQPWAVPPIQLPLNPPGSIGVDRLRLHFSINGEGQLELEGDDLLVGQALPRLVLGPVR